MDGCFCHVVLLSPTGCPERSSYGRHWTCFRTEPRGTTRCSHIRRSSRRSDGSDRRGSSTRWLHFWSTFLWTAFHWACCTVSLALVEHRKISFLLCQTFNAWPLYCFLSFCLNALDPELGFSVLLKFSSHSLVDVLLRSWTFVLL